MGWSRTWLEDWTRCIISMMLIFFCLFPGHISLPFLSPQDIRGACLFPLISLNYSGDILRGSRVASGRVCGEHLTVLPGANRGWVCVEQTVGNSGLEGADFYSVSKVC